MSEIRRAHASFGFIRLVVLGLAVAACGPSPAPTGTPGPSSSASSGSGASGSPAATPSPSAAGIEHPTGAADVVLRVSEVGGFMSIEFVASRMPAFTLYGDGTLLVAPAAQFNPAPGPMEAMIVATLAEADLQRVLETALTRGGLAIARESYESVGIMDAPTTVFEIHAGGIDKQVRVLALGMDEPQPGPDTIARKNFAELKVFLDGIAESAVQGGSPWTPAGFVGTLLELEAGQQAPAPPRAWPWDDLTPADFVAPAAGNDITFPEHPLTAEEIDALGLEPFVGGYQGIVLDTQDDKRYSLIIRPQLPDQAG